jgi:hypothetical protein
MRETYFAALPCCSESVFLLTSDSGAHFAGRVLRASKPQVIRGCRMQSEADNVSLRLEPPRHPRAVDQECDSDRQHRC